MKTRQLIEECHYIINYQALKAYKKLPLFLKSSISVEDLEQEGYIAFVKACRNYDASKGVGFETVLTTYLIMAFSKYIQDSYMRKRFPLYGLTSLEEMRPELEDKTNGFKHHLPTYEDTEFEAVDFMTSLEQVKPKVSDTANEFISMLESGEYIGKPQKQIAEMLNVGMYKLRKVSGEILTAVYGRRV
jgi:RNA polymerase sigma factor (sigma-70 family)